MRWDSHDAVGLLLALHDEVNAGLEIRRAHLDAALAREDEERMEYGRRCGGFVREAARGMHRFGELLLGYGNQHTNLII
jgi:hypothetical protein